MARTMPRQKPHQSEQVVVTPMEFVMAVERHLNIRDGFYIDLAATEDNTRAPEFFTPEDDSLTRNWKRLIPETAWAWLNPPYSDISPWVQKAKESQRQIVVLVPASVGSNWWKEHVHREAWVLFLNRRITFEGHTAGYPKDLALIVYGPDKAGCGYDIWDWRTANEVLG
jgi:phage N-6-adenine-methyltransferase